MFLPEDLYTELFIHMKGCAEKQGMEEVEKAYITYPASFDDHFVLLFCADLCSVAPICSIVLSHSTNLPYSDMNV